MLQLFKEEADQIRKEIDVMMNVLVEKSEVVQDELHQETRRDYKNLKGDIKAQRDENEIVYKTLKNVVKDTESQKVKIAVFQAKIEELEQHVGILANGPEAEMPLSVSGHDGEGGATSAQYQSAEATRAAGETMEEPTGGMMTGHVVRKDYEMAHPHTNPMASEKNLRVD